MSGWRAARAALTLALLGPAAAWLMPARATAEVRRFAPRLDAVTPVVGEVVLRGELRSSLDGSTFDALTQRDRFPALAGGAAPRLGGLFDPEAGGLRVADQDPDAHLFRLVPASSAAEPAPGCAAAGVPTPCLVPRLTALAHQRLVMASDLAATLAGSLEAEALPPPEPPLLSPGPARAALGLAVGGLLALAVLLARALGRARARTPLGQVRAAARQARRAVKREPALARVRGQIDAAVERARALDRARLACAARLGRLGPARLLERRAAWERVRDTAPDAGAALTALDHELGEARQLQVDLGSSLAGLERIASSLRAVALRARADRGTRAVTAGDPVAEMFAELELRDASLDEADLEGPATVPSGATLV